MSYKNFWRLQSTAVGRSGNLSEMYHLLNNAWAGTVCVERAVDIVCGERCPMLLTAWYQAKYRFRTYMLVCNYLVLKFATWLVFLMELSLYWVPFLVKSDYLCVRYGDKRIIFKPMQTPPLLSQVIFFKLWCVFVTMRRIWGPTPYDFVRF